MNPEATDADGRPRIVGLVFCGGCNPGYDRTAAAERLLRRVRAVPGYVVGEAGAPDMVIAVCGCDCACAEWSGPGAPRMITVTGPGRAEVLEAMIGGSKLKE